MAKAKSIYGVPVEIDEEVKRWTKAAYDRDL